MPVRSSTKKGRRPPTIILPTFLMHSLLATVRVFTVSSLVFLAAHAAEDAKRSYNVPAGDAAVALRQFSETYGKEVLFAAETVRSVRTPALRGEFTPQEAMAALLGGTGLFATTDAKTGAIAVRRTTPLPGPKQTAHTENEQTLAMERVEITGSRIRSLLGEPDPIAPQVFDRQMIEDAGVQSVGDLKYLIPQLSVAQGQAYNGVVGGTAVDGIVSMQLRGLTGNATLVLVDGRRLPRTRQSGVGSDYDLYGIPLASIERVEVLTDGGSSVYGADAVGGAVNIILRKNYRGGQIEESYENTTSGDAAILRSTLSVGYKLGKLSFNLSGNYETQNAIANVDRYWLASSDRRFLGGNDGRSAFPVGGRVRVATGTLPGIGSATALIPAKSDGKSVTIADYLAAGDPALGERYDSNKRTNVVNESRRSAFTLRSEYEVQPWLKPFVEARWNRAINFGKGDPLGGSQSLTLPAGYPGNPFGVPILVDKFYWEFGYADRKYTTTDAVGRVGLNGLLPHDWKYSTSIEYSKKDPEIEETVNQWNPTLFNAAVAAGERPIIAHNSLLGAANPAGALEKFFFLNPSGETNRVWSYDARADGPFWQLPAGPAQAAVGWESRQEYVKFARRIENDSTQAANPRDHRLLNSYYAEVRVPVFGPKKNFPLLRAVTLSASGRLDDYSDIAQKGQTTTYGVAWKPFTWLMVRGSRSEGFKAPLLIDLIRNPSTANTVFGTTGTFVLFDTLRNEQFLGTIPRFLGGNPNLKPEKSESNKATVVVEVPYVKGLSVEMGWWDTQINDQIITLTQIQDLFVLFPEKFRRADPTPADIAAGKPGVINYLDLSPINISLRALAGYDFNVRYNRPTPWGSFLFNAGGTGQTRNASYVRAGLTKVATIGLANRPLRVNGSLNWKQTRGPWGAGVTHVWQNGYRVSVTNGPDWPIYTQWNANVSYDFNKSALAQRRGWLGRMFKETRLNLATVNAFNEGIAFSPTGGTNPNLDPRLRRYVVTLRKGF
jgi:iron complex outermembrane receptor protein